MNSIWENPMSSWRSRVFALALMAGAAFPAWSQNVIQSINSSQSAGSSSDSLQCFRIYEAIQPPSNRRIGI